MLALLPQRIHAVQPLWFGIIMTMIPPAHRQMYSYNAAVYPRKEMTVKQYRIDAAHSNSYEVWKKMGSPQQPTAEQIALLEKEGQLKQVGTSKVKTKNGLLQLNMQLPRQGIVFIKIEW